MLKNLNEEELFRRISISMVHAWVLDNLQYVYGNPFFLIVNIFIIGIIENAARIMISRV